VRDGCISGAQDNSCAPAGGVRKRAHALQALVALPYRLQEREGDVGVSDVAPFLDGLAEVRISDEPVADGAERDLEQVGEVFVDGAVARSTLASDGSTKSLVSIEPERSTSSRRSRAGLSRWSGGSNHCGRISAPSASSQQTTRLAVRHSPRRPTTSPARGCRPVRVTSYPKNGTRTPRRLSRCGGGSRKISTGNGSSNASHDRRSSACHGISPFAAHRVGFPQLKWNYHNALSLLRGAASLS